VIQFISIVLSFVGAFLIVIATVVRRQPLKYFARFSRWALAQSGLRKLTVESPAGPQVFWEGGQGLHVVFLHGVGDQAGTWSKVLQEMPRSLYHVVAVDLAGHGQSAPAAGPLPMATLLQALEIVLEKYQQCVLVGNSLGAWLAFLYAHQFPDRVLRLVAVNGGPITGMRPHLSLMPENREDARRLFAALRDPGSKPMPNYVLDDVIREARRGPIGRFTEANADLSAYLLDERLDEITVPVDLLWGESDQMVPLEYAQRLIAGLPQSHLITIPQCGHTPQQERPHECAQALLGVLEKLR